MYKHVFKTLFLLGFILGIAPLSFAQADIEILPEKVNANVDTNYIGRFDKKLGLHFMTNMKFNRLRLRNQETEREVEYNPSENLKVGAGFFYQWLGLAFTFKLPQSDEHIRQKGQTEFFDTQVNLFAKKFVIDGYYQRYKGYYLSNYEEYFPNLDIEKEGYPLRGDIKTIDVGLNFTWIFNHNKYSLRSAFVMNEFQKRNAGSFLAGGFFAGNYNSADSALVDATIVDRFGSFNDIKELNTQSFGLTFGYGRIFIIKKRFFISLAFQAGPMYNNSNLVSSTTEVNDSFKQFGVKYIVRGAAGYNHKSFYFGITGIEDSYSFKNDDVVYTYQLGAVKFFLGKRLDFNKSLTLFKKKIFS